MLALWKRRHFLEPLRNDCSVTRTDGVDLDAICIDQMRQWYVSLLANAPTEMLASTNIASTITPKRTSVNSLLLTLPDNVVRVTSVKLSSWQREAMLIHSTSTRAKQQSNPFARGGIANPVAVLHANHTLELFSPGNDTTLPTVEQLLVISDPGKEKYIFDELALTTINNNLTTQ